MKTSVHILRRPLAATALLACGALLSAAALAQGHGPMAGGAGTHHGAGPHHGASAGTHHDKHGAQARHAAHGPMSGGGGMAMRMSERTLEQVGATVEQRAQIRGIMDAARTDLRAGREAARAQRGKLAELLAQPQVDAGAVEALRKEMVARHDAASKRMTQAMLDAGQVLTPDQRQKLAAHAQQRREMMQRHHQERRALEAPKS
jgi:Spy/CpxP family protein refolding chaperone